MRKDKQAKTPDLGLAMGELAVFLLAWLLGVTVAINGGDTRSVPANDIAASGSYSEMSDLLE